MARKNFTVTAKERQPGKPCFLVFETDEDIGLGRNSVVLDMPEGTDLKAANALAQAINSGAEKIGLLDKGSGR